jgi:hypothetical protein
VAIVEHPASEEDERPARKRGPKAKQQDALDI